MATRAERARDRYQHYVQRTRYLIEAGRLDEAQAALDRAQVHLKTYRSYAIPNRPAPTRRPVLKVVPPQGD